MAQNDGTTACERSGLTEREMIYFEAGVQAGKAEEHFRVMPMLERARWHLRWGTRRSALKWIDKAMEKEARDAANE